MYDELVEALRLCVKYGKAEDALANAQQAADAIEELSREYESIVKSLNESVELVRKLQQPPWIPVTERLPEKDGDYLVRCLIEDGDEPLFGIFPFDSNVPAFGYWDECYDPVTYGWAGSDFIEVKGVTHWMPLPPAPEPPKESV